MQDDSLYPLFRYRLFLPHGVRDVVSQLGWPLFWQMVKSDGFVLTSGSAIPIHAILEVQKIEGDPDNVVQLHTVN